MKAILAFLASLLGGAGVGVIASVYHAAFFPWGLVAVLFSIGGLLAGLRVIADTRYPAVMATLGIVVAITILAGADGRDSVMVAANPPGFALLIGVAVLAVFANGWPGRLSVSPVKMVGREPERTPQ